MVNTQTMEAHTREWFRTVEGETSWDFEFEINYPMSNYPMIIIERSIISMNNNKNKNREGIKLVRVNSSCVRVKK